MFLRFFSMMELSLFFMMKVSAYPDFPPRPVLPTLWMKSALLFGNP